jgi:hypothetical protein
VGAATCGKEFNSSLTSPSLTGMKEILLSIELKPTTVYIAEHPDGLCRVHLSPEEDMTAPGGGSAFEEELRAEFVWG